MPAGTFKAVTASHRHTCGLRADNTITCWGSNSFGQADAPAGVFKAVTAGGVHSCGLRTDGIIVCWGRVSVSTDTPAGAFKAVTAGYEHTCGLRTDDRIVCWGSNQYGQADQPGRTFTAVTTWDDSGACGLRTDNTITCWGLVYPVTPAGAFKTVSAGGGNHACGLRADNTITCWGLNLFGQTDAPAGTFKAVTAGPLALVRAALRRHHRLLGRQQGRADRRARRCVQSRLRRWLPLVRAALR